MAVQRTMQARNVRLWSTIVALAIVTPGIAAEPAALEVQDFVVSSPGMATIKQSERYLPIVGKADVVVAGGGVAGVAAALRAADEGLSVILIESRNYFGHELTGTYQCRTVTDLPAATVPLSRAMCSELSERGALIGDRLDPRALRGYLHGKVTAQPQIEIYLYARAGGVLVEGQRVRGVVFAGRDGRQAVVARAVVDATPDARLAAAASAELVRTFAGDNTARRFVAVRRPASLPPGPLAVPEQLGLSGHRVMVHDGFIELAVRASIGDDVARDLSAVQAETLQKCFALREHLSQSGIPPGSFTPGAEVWIDRTPVVACREPWSEEEIAALDFSRSTAVLPQGVDGLVVAGRTVGPSELLGSLQALLSVGEVAGRTAAAVARETTALPTPVNAAAERGQSDAQPLVRELLDGIERGTSYHRVRQSAMELPIRGRYDILVVGGGTSGAVAAIAAARQGARVAVVEILPNLGGIGSNRVHSYYWGVPWKSLLRQELGDRIQLVKRTTGGPLEKVSFSGEDKKHALEELALGAGVTIYYHSLGTGAVVEQDQVRGVVVENASGRHVLLARVVIDATGHAGIAVAAGAGFAKGRSTDGFLHEIERGPLRDPVHVGDITASYLRTPSHAISMNIRESRRILGDYVISFQDVLHERLFPDTICRWRSNYDTHFPNSANQSDLAQDWTAILGLWRSPILGSIAYRSLLPKGLENILVAAKAYSTDHDALIGGRMQPDMEHLGEAAGVAAAMACQLGVPPREVPVEQLQVELVRLGVLRDEDVAGRTITGGPSLDELHRQDFWREEREEQFPPGIEPPALDEAAGQLGDDDALDAMVRLYLAGDRALPLLRPLLEAEDQRAHEQAALLLGLLGDPAAVPALLEFLQQRNPRRFQYTLPQASSRPSVPLYWSAAILLGRFGEPRAVPAMLDLLKLPPPPAQYHAFRRTAYGDDMFRSTDECPPSLASFLIVALGRIGDARATEGIRPYLAVSSPIDNNEENKDFEIAWGVQTNAAWALSRMGDNSGVPVLIELLEADQALVRDYAQRLLENMTGERLGRQRSAWEQWWRSPDFE